MEEKLKVGNIYKCISCGCCCELYATFFGEFGLNKSDYMWKKNRGLTYMEDYELVYETKFGQSDKPHLKDRIFGVFRSVKTGQDFICSSYYSKDGLRKYFELVEVKNKLTVDLF